MRLTKIYAMFLVVVMVLTAAANTVSAEGEVNEWLADVVLYNIGYGEVSVGTEGMRTDYYFDKNGNFAIMLENNAHFPFEIEFQWGVDRIVKTFITSDSAVEVNGHVFTVALGLLTPPRGYVNIPYSFSLQASVGAGFEVISENLPPGMFISTESNGKRDVGEIYGASQQSGMFEVTVRTSANDTITFIIDIAPLKTIVGLYYFNDFNIIKPLGDFDEERMAYFIYEYESDTYREVEIKFEDWDSALDLCHPENFVDLWINGIRVDDADYYVRKGSTVITLRAQTFGKLKRDENHIIAAEFKDKDKDGKQYKAAQYFSFIVLEQHDDESGQDDETVDTHNNAVPEVELMLITTEALVPLAAKPPETIAEELPEDPFEPVVGNFLDVKPTDWFFNDILWAYEDQIMVGVSSVEFAPYMASNLSMVALTLARLSKADLSAYNVESGAWYEEAMVWAESEGVFDGISDVSHDLKIERGQLMVIIEKYLHQAGVNASITYEYIVFPDADYMTAEELEAFQLLCKLGIVHGKDDGMMDPRSILTRAELAAILHRVEEYKHKDGESLDKGVE